MDIIVTVHADEVIARFKAMPAAMRAAMTDTISRLTISMQRSVIENKLAGEVLGVRTGTLWRSIKQKVEPRSDGVFGQVYTNLDYGIAWENGFDRKIGAGARGGPRTLQGQALAKYYERHPPGLKHFERPYLKPTLEEFTPQIQEDIRATALRVIHG